MKVSGSRSKWGPRKKRYQVVPQCTHTSTHTQAHIRIVHNPHKKVIYPAK